MDIELVSGAGATIRHGRIACARQPSGTSRTLAENLRQSGVEGSVSQVEDHRGAVVEPVFPGIHGGADFAARVADVKAPAVPSSGHRAVGLFVMVVAAGRLN